MHQSLRGVRTPGGKLGKDTLSLSQIGATKAEKTGTRLHLSDVGRKPLTLKKTRIQPPNLTGPPICGCVLTGSLGTHITKTTSTRWPSSASTKRNRHTEPRATGERSINREATTTHRPDLECMTLSPAKRHFAQRRVTAASGSIWLGYSAKQDPVGSAAHEAHCGSAEGRWFETARRDR